MKTVGVLGFAHGHIMAFGKAWQDGDFGVKIVAGWDHDATRLANSKTALGFEHAYDTPEALLASDVDAVVITAETRLHCELVEKAAAAGKTILCYKPLALTMEQADRCVAAVEKYGVRFSMGMQMRVDPQNLKIKELIDNGTIGKVFGVRRRHGLWFHGNEGFYSMWHNNPADNRDIFADDSSHPIDYFLYLLGMPESVTAELSTADTQRMPNDSGIVIFRYPNGMLAEINCCFVTAAAKATMEVYGEKGAILLDYGDGPSTMLPHDADGLRWYVVGDGDWTHSNIPSPAQHGARIANQAAPIAAFIKGEREPIATVYEARDALRLVLCCYVSSQTGTRVSVDDGRVYDIQ